MKKLSLWLMMSLTLTLLMVGIVAAVATTTAFAQVPDKDHGASTFAPKKNEAPAAGGWMPMEGPGWMPNGASEADENNPGQQGQEAGIIGPD